MHTAEEFTDKEDFLSYVTILPEKTKNEGLIDKVAFLKGLRFTYN